MKKFIAALLAGLTLFTLVGCSGGSKADSSTPKDYSQIIHDARSDEDNEYDMIFTKGEDGKFTAIDGYSAEYEADQLNEEIRDILMPPLNLEDGQYTAFAASISSMMVRSYAVAIVKPAEGKTDEVKAALEAYVASEQQSMEHYLEDQYLVAKAATVTVAPTGEVVLDLTIISSYFGAVIGIINYYVSFGKGYQESRASFDRVQTIMAIEEEPKGEARPLKIDYILADLTFQYNNDSFVLKNEKIQVKKGEAFGIFGKNGSGKTTAVKLLIGLYPTSENGEVTFNGVDINKLDMEYMRGNKISYVMQNPKMTKKSVSGLFEEINCEITYETVCQSFSFLSNSLRELALKTIKEFWLKPFYSMSEGERQFITIIRALYKNPEILIMDEPSSSLDSLRQQWLLDLISEIKKDRMVIIISHDMALQDVCDKYIFLD